MIGTELVLMMRRLVHILVVLGVSFGVVAASALGGNVLCLGDDGHLAIEPPHQPLLSPTSVLPFASDQHLPEKPHGPCNDVGANVEVVVRQTAVGVLETPTIVIPPVLDVALPPPLIAVRLAPVAHSNDAALPAPALGRLRGVVLLI